MFCAWKNRIGSAEAEYVAEELYPGSASVTCDGSAPVVNEIVWAAIAGTRQWGPARVRGMATRAEADTLLGVGRLRKVAPVVRPDLHGKAPRS